MRCKFKDLAIGWWLDNNSDLGFNLQTAAARTLRTCGRTRQDSLEAEVQNDSSGAEVQPDLYRKAM